MIFTWIDVLLTAFSFFSLGVIVGHKLPRICPECVKRDEENFRRLVLWFFRDCEHSRKEK